MSSSALDHADLLMLAVSEESAHRVENHLRDHGRAMRVQWCADLDSLRQALARQEPDVLLIEDPQRDEPPLALLRIARDMRPDTPVILLGAAREPARLATALAAGAHDLATPDDEAGLAHLEGVVLRALELHRLRRELRRAQRALDDSRARHRQLAAGSTDAIAHMREGILTAVNGAFAQLVGAADPAALEGLPLMDLVMPEQQAAVRERLRQLLNGRDDGQPLALALRGADGTAIAVDAHLILGEDAGERTVDLVVAVPAAAPAGHPQTRAEFCAQVDQRRADARPRALLLLRIDGLSSIEERLGPVEAERLADTAFDALETLYAADDLSLHLGLGERMLCICRATTAAIEELSETLRLRLAEQANRLPERARRADTLVALLPLAPERPTADAVAGLIRFARKALSPPDQVLRPDRAGPARTDADQQRTEQEIRAALAAGSFDCAFQAIASLEGNSVPLHDVLLRMQTTGGERRAREFLPAAAALGLTPAIDRWVVEHMLGVAARGGPPRHFLIKLTAETLTEAESFLDWLGQRTLPPKDGPVQLTFELREDALQDHMRRAQLLAAGLVRLGLGLAIEHYGSSPHSAQILDHLPLRYLKFHPDFIRNFNRRDQQARLASLLEAARAHELRTIVSFVEDANLLARLWQMGVHYVQGYQVQEPAVVLGH